MGLRAGFGNIGHSAHLGGAVAGILLSIALEPAIFEANTWIIVALLLPFVLFMAVVIRRPESMLIGQLRGIRTPPVFGVPTGRTGDTGGTGPQTDCWKR